MVPYLLLILAFIILSFFVKNKKAYCFICSTILIILVGFRDPNLGKSDTLQLYLPYFRKISLFSFNELVNFVKSIDTEFLFYFISFLFSKITTNETLYLLFITIPIYIIIGRFIYKYSKYPFLSFIMLLSLNYFGYTFYILRHMVALSILLLAFEKFIQKKTKSFILLVILASLFHRTALVFLLILFFGKIKINKKILIVSILPIFCFIYLFGPKLLNIIFSFIKDGHYLHYVDNGLENNLMLFFINLFLLLFMILFASKNYINTEENQNNFIFINVQIIACILALFVPFLSEFMRLSSFFSIISIVSIPNTISQIENVKLKQIVYLIMTMLLIIYFLKFSIFNNNLVPYTFG